jgi:hypothetical protein
MIKKLPRKTARNKLIKFAPFLDILILLIEHASHLSKTAVFVFAAQGSAYATAHIGPSFDHGSPVVFVLQFTRLHMRMRLLISRKSSLFIFARTICKCPEVPSLFCFNLWSYCACARHISRQSSLFLFLRVSAYALKCLPFFFILWSYCACARLISRQSSLFSFAYLQMPGNIFLFQSYCACARLICRGSPLFIFCAYLKFLFVSFCGLTAHAPGSFAASRLCSFFALICNSFFMFHSMVLLRMRQAHSVSFRGGGAPQPVTSCSEQGSSFYHAGSGLNM